MKTAWIFLALPLAIAGCTSTKPDAAFNDVNQTIRDRTGSAIKWTRLGSTNESVEQLIAPFLRSNLTAASAVDIALLNNRSLQAEFEEIGISQADLAQAARLPNLQLMGSWRFPNRPPSIADTEYSAAANVLDLVTMPARKHAAGLNLEQTRLEVSDRVLQLAAETQTAFYTLQADTELTARLNTILEVNAAAADFAQRQHDAGNITDLEWHSQQAPAIQARLDLMEARAKLSGERERLNRLMGLAGEQIRWQIADQLPPLPASDPALDNLEVTAVKQRLDLAAKRKQAEGFAAALRLKRRTRFIPGATLGIDTEQTPDGQRVTGPTLGLELPLFDQGQPAIAKLVAQYEQARDNYAAQEIDVRSEVRAASDALVAAREAVEFSEKHLRPLREQILRETLLQYNAMQKSSYDLLAAKEREQLAQQRSIEALRDYWQAQVALERAVGGRLPNNSNSETARKLP